MDFNFVKLLCTIRLDADIADPFALYAIRGGFTDAFRGADIHAYHATFVQPLSGDPAAVKRYQKPALPFVFDLPLLPAAPNRGALMEFGLTLIGSAITFLPVHIEALRSLFGTDAVRGTLTRVASLDYFSRGAVLWEEGRVLSPDRLTILSADGLPDTRILSPDRVRLSISTPLRLLHEGKTLRRFEPSAFLRTLVRRVSSLAYYYAGAEMEADYKWLAGRSREMALSDATFRWVEWKEGGRLGGVTGEGDLVGELSDFHPFLLLGEHLHVGKGCSYGLGRYRILPP